MMTQVMSEFKKGQVVYIDDPIFNGENYNKEIYVVIGIKEGYTGFKYKLKMIENEYYDETLSKQTWEHEEFLRLAKLK